MSEQSNMDIWNPMIGCLIGSVVLIAGMWAYCYFDPMNVWYRKMMKRLRHNWRKP